jgi:hypothetical protein
MLGSVDLNNELGARSIEIYDKTRNRPLAIKLNACNLFPPYP